jgi:hypothetical protein
VEKAYRMLRRTARQLLKSQKAKSVFEPRIFARLADIAVQLTAKARL